MSPSPLALPLSWGEGVESFPSPLEGGGLGWGGFLFAPHPEPVEG
jgi:hypothetical protein